MITLKPLGYELNALEPKISEKTLTFHHGKHHQTYVDNLNKLIIGTEFEAMSLEEIVLKSSEGIFNNAAQVYNHDLYFANLTNSGSLPGEQLLASINRDFGSLENLLAELKDKALKQFGSGWAWLVIDNGKLKAITTANAANPLTMGLKPLLVIDIWEHAYYLDYQNRRADYLDAILTMIDWQKIYVL